MLSACRLLRPRPAAWRVSSSASSSSCTNTPDIPAPTWSVADLRLRPEDTSDLPASTSELHSLGRRCLIDVRFLAPPAQENLKRDLAGILRCVSAVEEFASALGAGGSAGPPPGPDELYDPPRGRRSGGGAPLREDGADANAKEGDWSGREEALTIIERRAAGGRGAVTTTADGETQTYFSVVTGRRQGRTIDSGQGSQNN